MNVYNILFVFILIVLLGFISFLGYYTNKFIIINNNLNKKFNEETKCYFNSNGYIINNNRLEINVMTNTLNNITLYYPINYYEEFNFKYYNNTYYFNLFYDTLLNNTFTCMISKNEKEAYFNDYSNYSNIRKYISSYDVMMIFVYLLCSFVSILLITIIIYFVCSSLKKKERYNYNTIYYN
jgi:hypothetical protein